MQNLFKKRQKVRNVNLLINLPTKAAKRLKRYYVNGNQNC